MQSSHVKNLVALAITGLTTGLSGCGGSSPPAAAPTEEPSGEKHACGGKPGEKHACGGKEEKHEGDAPAGAEEGKDGTTGK